MCTIVINIISQYFVFFCHKLIVYLTFMFPLTDSFCLQLILLTQVGSARLDFYHTQNCLLQAAVSSFIKVWINSSISLKRSEWMYRRVVNYKWDCTVFLYLVMECSRWGALVDIWANDMTAVYLVPTRNKHKTDIKLV